MEKNSLSSISILIPTLNAASVLGACLQSIAEQDYPKDKIEIIIADGGSTDNTLSIANKLKGKSEKLKIKILANPLRTGEAGKAVALRHAKGELVALVDSDNILPDKNWLKRMVEPFSDPEIVGSEPWEFTYRKNDGFITRYCALLGMNDPLCHFLGNYDRLNALTGKWTSLPVKQEDKGGWLKVTLTPDTLPTIGANGTFLRKSRLGCVNTGAYFVDIDIIAKLATKEPVKFAKVKTGIIHLYCGSSITTFIRKQRRRIKDYLYYKTSGQRAYPWQKQGENGILKFVLSCVTIILLFYQATRGYLRKPDCAWVFHPLACWLTLGIYGATIIESYFRVRPESREKWRQ